MIAAAADVARFTDSDPDDLVVAALACPYCLRTAAAAELRAAGRRVIAHAFCGVCEGAGWEVALAADQARRVSALPHELLSVLSVVPAD